MAASMARSGTKFATAQQQRSRSGRPGTVRYNLVVLASSEKSPAHQGKVGFIGLGHMGLPMMQQLFKAGHHLVVYDPNKFALGRAIKLGDSVESSTSPADLAAREDVSVLFTMLPHPSTVEEVYLGPNGLLAGKGGSVPSLMVDCSTVDPPLARKIAAKANFVRLGPRQRALLSKVDKDTVAFLDAPVSGGVAGAEKGTLSFMVGGEESALAVARPLLHAMGTGGITYCGSHGTGQAARLCNTLAMAASMAATSECLALAKRLGLDPKVMTAVLNSSSGRSWSSEVYNPIPGICPDVPPSHGYQGGLSANSIIEQLGMVVTAAEHSHSPVPLARYLSTELYSKVCQEGLGDKDFSSVFRYYYGSGSSQHEWEAGEQLFSSNP